MVPPAMTIGSAKQIVASMGLDSFADLTPRKLFRRVDPHVTKTYADLYEWLKPETTRQTLRHRTLRTDPLTRPSEQLTTT